MNKKIIFTIATLCILFVGLSNNESNAKKVNIAWGQTTSGPAIVQGTFLYWGYQDLGELQNGNHNYTIWVWCSGIFNDCAGTNGHDIWINTPDGGIPNPVFHMAEQPTEFFDVEDGTLYLE